MVPSTWSYSIELIFLSTIFSCWTQWVFSIHKNSCRNISCVDHMVKKWMHLLLTLTSLVLRRLDEKCSSFTVHLKMRKISTLYNFSPQLKISETLYIIYIHISVSHTPILDLLKLSRMLPTTLTGLGKQWYTNTMAEVVWLCV